MKILNELSIKDLKLNKKRSIVIIVGIILSTALICGVAGLVTSFQYTITEMEKTNSGNYHAMFYDVPKDELKYIEQNRNVDKYYLSESLGLSTLQKSELEEKPSINVVSADEKFLNNMAVNVEEGRLPENDSEIVISNRILAKCKVDLKVGDKIELNKTYTIVGIVERPIIAIESYDDPWYTVFTKMQSVQGDKANIAVLYKNVYKYQDFTEQINNMKIAQTDKEKGDRFGGLSNLYTDYKYKVVLNTTLLAYEGANLSDAAMKTIYAMGGIVMAIVLVSSVFVIRNGFAISITERLKQYGMLSSIGTTKKQLKKSVYFEGFILGLIAIPLGILSGIFAIFVLLKVVNFILKDFIMQGSSLRYHISWLAIVVSAIVASITIWLSCKSSAKKASKVTPIEAIRSTQDIQLKDKKLKCPKIITKLFKTGGEIAYKNLKRSRKKYRTTIISIIVSVVIFIAISSFIQYGFQVTSSYYTERENNFFVTYSDSIDEMSEEDAINLNKKQFDELEKIAQLDNIEKYSNKRNKTLTISNLNDKLTDFGKSLKEQINVSQKNAKEDTDYITLVSLGKSEYERFLNKIGGNYEKYKDGAILLETYQYRDKDGKVVKGSKIYDWSKGDKIVAKDENKTYEINIVQSTDKRPMGLEDSTSNISILVVSDEYMDKLGLSYNSGLAIKSNNPKELEKEIEQYRVENQIPENAMYVSNFDEAVRAENAVILVISIFLYGFITVITLIGVTNIFNTITTNMNLRRKEFAMLKSIGMTKAEFNRMIRLESIFYGLKSLIIGIPLGIGLSYLLFKGTNSSMQMGYMLPVKPIVISIVFVAVIVGVIMRYSMAKINKQNIIETIRNDNI